MKLTRLNNGYPNGTNKTVVSLRADKDRVHRRILNWFGEKLGDEKQIGDAVIFSMYDEKD